jgi:hypothetical protein
VLGAVIVLAFALLFCLATVAWCVWKAHHTGEAEWVGGVIFTFLVALVCGRTLWQYARKLRQPPETGPAVSRKNRWRKLAD